MPSLLSSPKRIKSLAEYMTAVLETNEPDPWLLALSDIARAKGMTQVAKDAGPGRESLYKDSLPAQRRDLKRP